MKVEKLEKLEDRINKMVGLIYELKDENNELVSRNNELEAEVQKAVDENSILKEKKDIAKEDQSKDNKEKSKQRTREIELLNQIEALEKENAELKQKLDKTGSVSDEKVDSLMEKIDSLDI